jgi:hypothetical protein
LITGTPFSTGWVKANLAINISGAMNCTKSRTKVVINSGMTKAYTPKTEIKPPAMHLAWLEASEDYTLVL